MNKPEKGAVFVNPRGRTYEVLGPTHMPWSIVVRDLKTGICDLADWELMTPENGWRERPATDSVQGFLEGRLDGSGTFQARYDGRGLHVRLNDGPWHFVTGELWSAKPGDPTARHLVAWLRASDDERAKWCAEELDHVFFNRPRS